uniref:DUF6985 domain-containing protein n=1 Tax=Thaumasiovibrio occultus TaxID=1891184 RepID=UPI000B34EE26|nr:hypothetical protein [Thaumasiovibrio occultus]
MSTPIALSAPDENGCCHSGWLAMSVFDGAECRFVVEHYALDDNPHEFHQAMHNLLRLSPCALYEAQEAIYAYYQKINAYFEPEDEEYVEIAKPQDVWSHIEFGADIAVSRRSRGDKGIYLSITCWCAWEEEHGLQVVFKQGQTVNKVGPFDGHLSHADSYGDPSLEEVIYL